MTPDFFPILFYLWHESEPAYDYTDIIDSSRDVIYEN